MIQSPTIIASHQREALPTYEGERGYPPMLAVWAETDLILADQFRDGNVPPMQAPLRVAQAAFAALPETCPLASLPPTPVLPLLPANPPCRPPRRCPAN